MNFSFTEEQDELRSAARAFLEDHSGSDQVRAAMEGDLGYDAGVWKRVGSELGWPSVIVPEEYGGIGLGAVELVALMELMGEYLFCSPFFATVCLGANAILEAGTHAQKSALLPGLAEGETRATLAFSEADGRWDVDGIATLARANGDGFVLEGRKRYVLDGHTADAVVVPARAEGSSGDGGVSLFWVPGDAEGVRRRALPAMDMTRRQAEVELHGVRVPADALLGEEGGGAGPLRRTLDLATVALTAEQVGGAQRCLDLSVAYAKEREQFGRPIGSFQAVKHKCADMMVAVETARSAAYYAGCVAAEERAELPVAASLAKSYCSEAYFRCAAETIQIFGGVGFTWEYDPHLYFKRARASESLLGDPAHHRERVAREIGL